MVTPSIRRVLVLAILLALLGGLLVGYGLITPNPDRGHYPSSGSLGVDYDQYVGAYVRVSGTVTQTTPVMIQDRYSVWAGDHYRTGTVRLQVTGLERPVRPGQTLQMYGIARSDGTIRAVNSVAVSSSSYRYMYAISALAGVWVLLRLVRGWTIDRATLSVHRRATPLRYSDLRPSSSEEEANA